MQIIMLHNFTYKLKVNLTNKKNVYLEATIQNWHLMHISYHLMQIDI